MTAHPHAENMRLYAEDAAETDKPWERWQFRWADDEVWVNASDGLMWDVDTQYRRKPKPLECWVNVHTDAPLYYKSRDEALKWAEPNSFGEVLRAAVHLREVTE